MDVFKKITQSEPFVQNRLRMMIYVCIVIWGIRFMYSQSVFTNLQCSSYYILQEKNTSTFLDPENKFIPAKR